MKLASITFLLALALALAPQTPARNQPDGQKAEAQSDDAEQREASKEDFALERRANADASVVVSTCIETGEVVVRGWDRGEVRARTDEAGSLRLLTPNVQPAPRVEVLVDAGKDVELDSGDCGSAGRIELMVPRGATVNIKLRSGHVEVADVGNARVEVLSGDVNVRRVSKSVEVSVLSGDISLADSSGQARLSTMSGSIEARNVRTVARGDDFEAKSTSGDVMLEGVAHAQVSGSTVSGDVTFEGGLARGGVYEFKTHSGDVVLELPANSSFSVHAKVVVSGDIITDFPVKTSVSTSSVKSSSASVSASASPSAVSPRAPVAPPAPPDWQKPGKHKPPKPPKVPTETRLDGMVGTGDAVVTLSSFSGSVYLRKQ
ncbi:MAG TPA: DUF4097 family beta strand repeat-containing protein [Pyrinomonadaceae bacterium]|nr:DUF4097 family beta strand repeat-containing protein [Pyrinomonadaceae bacterium]